MADDRSFYLEKEEGVLTDLDPHLQHLLLAHAEGEVPGAGSGIVSSEGGQFRVDVFAKLKYPDQAVAGLRVVAKQGNLVTGTVAIPDIAGVRLDPNVESLKAASSIFRSLNVSVPEIRCDGVSLRAAFPGLSPDATGAGVIVGIVDYGCDFRHGNFRTAADETRLLYLWDQRELNFSERRAVRPTAAAPAVFGYGREFTASALNGALGQVNPYSVIDYELGAGDHGTHVMDIAAGNGRQTGRPGVAPEADLIFVHLDTGDISGEESLGNSRRLIEAVSYIFAKAAELGKPAVVNLSLGTHGGPHDGTTPVEQWLDDLLQTPGRAITIAAGNSFRLRSHTHGEVPPGQAQGVSWEILLDDLTPNEMEIWYGGDTPLEVTLVLPGGQDRLGPVKLGETQVIRRADGRMAGRVIHRKSDPSNGHHHLDILLDRSLPRGTWEVQLSNRGSQSVSFHAWVERDDAGQSRIAANQETTSHTLGSICCGRRTIAVGSYDARTRSLSSFTVAGPTRDGRDKPDIAAPGSDVVAARSLGNSMPLSGTSMAAPHVAGLAALLFQLDRSLSSGALAQLLRNSARRNVPGAAGPDPRFGFGRIDGVAALMAVRPQVPAPAPVNRAAVVGAYAAPPGAPNNGDYSMIPALLARMLSGTSDFRISVQVEPIEPS
jgi:subtilisin family serine protease